MPVSTAQLGMCKICIAFVSSTVYVVTYFVVWLAPLRCTPLLVPAKLLVLLLFWVWLVQLATFADLTSLNVVNGGVGCTL